MNARDKNSGVINIHGKEYQTVALRVQKFRDEHPEWTLKTSIVYRDEACVVMLAEILDDQGRLIANGHSEEFRSASSINKTSALENSETSAIGRALAALGFGGTEFCSADELVNAITKKQEVKPKESAKSVSKSDFDNLTPEKQKEYLSVAADVIDSFINESQEVAYDYYCQFKDELESAEEQSAWRGCFPSNIRTAFQKFYTQRQAQSLATQA